MPVDKSGRRATRIAKFTIDVLWWVGLVFGVTVACLFTVSPLLMERSGFVARVDWNTIEINTDGGGPPEVGLQVSIIRDSASSLPPLTSPDTMRAAHAVLKQETRTRLEFRTRRSGFFFLANAMFLPFVATMLLGIHLLRSFLADVLAADVFTARNAGRLSKLGWLVIVVGIAGPKLEYWRASMILEHIQLSGATLQPAGSDATGLWLLGVLVLVLAAVWRYGAELQQERDLTV